jgi:uncharacterized membrane protein
MTTLQLARLIGVTVLAFISGAAVVWFGWDLAVKLYTITLERLKRRKLRGEDEALESGGEENAAGEG